ncbi:NADH-quinone oxidoreductase subunit C [Streptomyces sp. NRRL F-5630]|uniref:NADH-quinone oxidoreductase subunit C n=1 Tax=Streptomyces sp. NRRL F-5630 TaxID=1463864 RepID=UPI003D7454D1
MTGWLPGAAEEVFGTGASAEEAYGLLTVDVPADTWTASLDTARRVLGCTYFDWLSAVDEPGTGFRVCAHVVALAPVRRLLLRTTVPHESPVLASAVGVYAGAAWHERETHEMFGLRFDGHPDLSPLLLPETFEGHPLRKDFVLAARVAKAWPGAKEPGESGHGTPKRRQMLPPGVPDPNEWGPLKGQLPEAPARPARRTRTAGGAAGAAGAAADRGAGAAPGAGEGTPARRARSASAGSASQRAEPGAAPARRSRTASEGSATQRAEPGAAPARRSRTASEGSASQRDTPEGGASPAGSPDAPWHHARPAFEPTRPDGEPTTEREKPRGRTAGGGGEAGAEGAGEAEAGAEAQAAPEAEAGAGAPPRTGKPRADEPGTEEPQAEQPGTQEPPAEEPRTEEPPAERRPAEDPRPQGPRRQDTRPADPPTDDPRPENPAGGEPA